MGFHCTNLTFPDLSPVASVCPSGLILRHLTPALWESLLESRMFFIAVKKSMVVTKKQQSHKGENTSLYFLKACQQSYLKQKIISYDLINIDVGKPSDTLNDFIGQL